MSIAMFESIFSVYGGILKKRPILTAVILLIYVAVVATFASIAQQEKGKLSDSKFRELVASQIIKSVNGNTDIETLSRQIKIIFNSYDRASKGKLSEYGLVSLLEDAFAKIATNPKEKENLKTLMKLISKQKEKDPYYGLKFEQEIIIKNLEKELVDPNSSSGFVEQIKEIVRRQNADIDELKKSNSWGMPVGIAGVTLTILFGLMGLMYPLLNKNKG